MTSNGSRRNQRVRESKRGWTDARKILYVGNPKVRMHDVMGITYMRDAIRFLGQIDLPFSDMFKVGGKM
jgi:hypothetical protein